MLKIFQHNRNPRSQWHLALASCPKAHPESSGSTMVADGGGGDNSDNQI